VRRDGHQPIITMQCGPIRYRTDPKGATAMRALDRLVVPRLTDFAISEASVEPGIQAIYSALAANGDRNKLIIADVLAALVSCQHSALRPTFRRRPRAPTWGSPSRPKVAPRPCRAADRSAHGALPWRHLGDGTPQVQGNSALYMLGSEVRRATEP
jgi:hypothetical protein